MRRRRKPTLSLAVVCLAVACGGKTESTGAGGGLGGGGTGGGTGGSGGSVSGGGGSGSTVKSGCFGVVASGDLPKHQLPGAIGQGPAVVATDTGFVIGYVEWGEEGTAVVVSLSDDGSLGAPTNYGLPGCGWVPDARYGLGMAWGAGGGILVGNLPKCSPSKGAGALFLPFDTAGIPNNAAGPQNALFDDLSLARVGAVAATPSPNEFEFLYRVVSSSGPVVERIVLQGSSFKSTPIVHPFGDDDRAFGSVVTGEKLRAYGAPDAIAQTTEVAIDDNASEQFDEKGKLPLMYAPYLALSAMDAFLIAAVPALMLDGSRGIELELAQLSGGTASWIGTGSIGSSSFAGPVPDQAINDSSLAFAKLAANPILLEGSKGELDLYRIQPFTPLPTDTASFTGTDLGASLDAFDGARVAIAAARGRIVVVWLDTSGPSDVSGHFAVLDCQNPGQ